MKGLTSRSAASLLAISAALALTGQAEATCTPNVVSDSTLSTCIGTTALGSNTGGFNVAIGFAALSTNTTGNKNTAAGYAALNANTIGSANTAVGLGTLQFNTTGSRNTADGVNALQYNTTGSDNAASGAFALRDNTTGNYNTATGEAALLSNTSGNYNTASGMNALTNNTTGNTNIALGFQAGSNFTTGSNNIAIGNPGVAGESASIRIGTQGTQTKAFMAGIRNVALSGGQAVVVNSAGQLGVAPAIPGTGNVALGGSALVANTTGNYNTAAGASALSFNTTGAYNTATGTAALTANTTGSNNTASGTSALRSNTVGAGNSASGVNALRANTQGNFNTASGANALLSNTTGSQNVAIGYEAAKLQTTGSANTAIGFRAGQNWTIGSSNIAIANPGVAGEQKTIRIGVQGTQTRAFVAGVRGVNVTGGQAVVVDANGQLGVVSSSRRYKQDIRPMGDASNALLQLHPVTFHYKQAEADGSRPLQYGLVAEEVAQVMPELAIYNAEGEPESVAYQLLPSLLLNEYQRQAKELTDTRAELDSTAAALAQSRGRLDAVEAEMAQMKLMLANLASAGSPGKPLASDPGE